MAKRGEDDLDEPLVIRTVGLQLDRLFATVTPVANASTLAAMPLLIIDASGKSASVAICTQDDGQLFAGEVFVPAGRSVASLLMIAIERVLASANLTVGEVKAIAAAHGPGSFTGLRIGLATARSLGWALNLPVTGFSSLAALAASCVAHNDNLPSKLHVVSNAYRGEWFYACWEIKESGSPAGRWPGRQCTGDCRKSTAELLTISDADADAVFAVSEEDFAAAAKVFSRSEQQPMLVPVRRDAATMLAVAFSADFGSADLLLPQYLRGSAAEENRA